MCAPCFNLFSEHVIRQRYAMEQQSWLLKTAAIELRTTSLNKQRSHMQRLLDCLLDDGANSRHCNGTAVTPMTNLIDRLND